MANNPFDPQYPDEVRGLAPGRGRLVGRRVLVIGGGQADHGGEDDVPGNGRAMSLLSGREGAHVVVADLNFDAAEETARRVRDEGTTATAIAGDATSDTDMQRMIADAEDIMGGIDGLVMNVGVDFGYYISGTTVDQWDQVFAINTRSHFLGVKYAMPKMGAGGSVVLMSSTSAFSAGGAVPAMSASKAALSTLALHAAKEHAVRQVRCNVIAPGLIDTPLGRSGGRKRADRASIEIPIGRFGSAWDVAYATVFLLSHEASYITGTTLLIDGGRMIK